MRKHKPSEIVNSLPSRMICNLLLARDILAQEGNSLCEVITDAHMVFASLSNEITPPQPYDNNSPLENMAFIADTLRKTAEHLKSYGDMPVIDILPITKDEELQDQRNQPASKVALRLIKHAQRYEEAITILRPRLGLERKQQPAP